MSGNLQTLCPNCINERVEGKIMRRKCDMTKENCRNEENYKKYYCPLILKYW